MNRSPTRLLGTMALLLAAAAICPPGCSDHPKGVTGEPSVDLRNKDLQANQRIEALEAEWNAVTADATRLPAARQASKDLLWKFRAPQPVRQRALALLLTDTSPAGTADTCNCLRQILPLESQWPVIVDICNAIGSRTSDPAWQVETAALVRSYARVVPVPPDEDRPERAALLALHPGKDLTAVVFDVFVRPSENGSPKVPDDYAQNARKAAWDLLGRLDPDGSHRTALAAGEASNDPTIKEINRCAHDLGVVPLTGSELTWMQGLLDEKNPRNISWWSAATRAVGTLGSEQRSGLQLRHIEPIRWAAANHPDWLTRSREQLLSELTGTLTSRRIWLKTEGLGQMEEKSKETLRDWAPKLCWADLLTILAIDEAVHQHAAVAALFAQAAQDQADISTEYGGLLWSTDQGGAPTEKNSLFALRGYQPRTTERKDDRTFIAPQEMFSDSPRSLAHYHFHVQSPNNRDYAGPGRGDMDYATMHGRNCLVFTSVRQGVMDVDYYQRNGVVIDLGEISAGQ